MANKLLGFNATINRNGSIFATPAWIPLIVAKDIKENREPAGTPDTSDRATNNYSTIGTRYKVSFDFDALWNKGAGLTALRTAFLAGNSGVIDLSVLDRQPATSGTGHRGEFAVTKFNLDFPLLGEQKLSTSIVPHASHAAGQAVGTYTDATVSAGTPETPSTKRMGQVASVNTSGGTPIGEIRDWKLNLEWTTADAGDRNDLFEKVLLTQIRISAELNFLWDTTIANLVAFKTAFEAHSAIDLWLLDGAYATGGSWGVHADWAVTNFSKDDPLTDGQKVTVTLMPHGNAVTTPTFVTR